MKGGDGKSTKRKGASATLGRRLGVGWRRMEPVPATTTAAFLQPGTASFERTLMSPRRPRGGG